MPKDLKRVLVHLREAHLEELDGLAAETAGSRAELIRTAIAQFLVRERRKATAAAAS